MRKVLIPIMVFLSFFVQAQEEDLSLLNFYQYYGDQSNALYKEMVDEASVMLQERAENIAGLKTKENWKQRQAEVREKLMKIVGPFPEKTPLNSQITETLVKDGIKVEKLIYESQPGFYVTAGLFMPKTLKGKAPAIIYCSGHTELGFRSDTYQHKILNLVHKGFVVLAFDPLGQGERMQYPEAEGKKSRIGGPTKEHGYAGAQSFISGSSLAKHMIWDGIRTVDYLLTRPEIDPKRIGMTGRSGGGTQTAYIAAFDERIYAAATEAYVTTLDILLKTKGPQDAEQNFMHFIEQGLDIADLLEVRAPKPAMIISTTRDFFSIEGARQAYAEVQQVYQAFGMENNISMSEDDEVHASTPKNREAMYAFFQKHLQNPGDSEDKDVAVFTFEELQVTSSGQVATALDSKNVFELNREESQKKKARVIQQRTNFQPEKIVQEAQKLSGYEAPKAAQEVHFAGQYQREGYNVQKYLMIEEKHVNPYLLFVPDGGQSNQVVLYFHPEGKAAQASAGDEIEALVKQGLTVLSADVLGTGELGPGYLKGDAYIEGVSYNQWFASILVNQSIVARQAADMVSMVRHIQQNNREIEISAIAHSTLAPALLHAAAFEPAIEKIALVEPLISYASLVEHESYAPEWIPANVAGSLRAYDLADLAATLAPRKLLIINPQNHMREAVNPQIFEEEWSFVRQTYQNKSDFIILYPSTEKGLSTQMKDWLK
ncbi:alpha/beta hydrolase family protein [Catalinimonas niigatensis]|uniref:alpha/beta hydrolase family protein n=1 Tax=Catalinimonas niigatensis TaxID=1397264 RepID=UPI00266630F8|nr:acetylxylan esterase [Catalinimonas niigatensis]WPP49111.1 acetylxylan esterase [Catalinimonas niigatensis]